MTYKFHTKQSPRAKAFPTEDVVSAATGVMLVNDVAKVQRVIEFYLGKPIKTQEIPKGIEEIATMWRTHWGTTYAEWTRLVVGVRMNSEVEEAVEILIKKHGKKILFPNKAQEAEFNEEGT